VYLAKCYGFPWSIGASLVVAASPVSRRPKTVAAVYAAAFLLGSFPWLLALHAQYGRWGFCYSGPFLVPGSGYRALAQAQGMEWTGSVLAPHRGQRHVWEDPARMPQRYDVRWERAWLQQGLLYNLRGLARILWQNPAIALALCCLLKISRRTSGIAWLCAGLAALWIFGYLLVFLEYRYLLPAMSLSFVAAATTSQDLWDGARRRRLLVAAIGVTLASI